MNVADYPIVVLGAGAIGCYVGGNWAYDGLNISFLARPWMAAKLDENGLKFFTGGKPLHLAAGTVKTSADPKMLTNASCIVVTIKSSALGEAIVNIKEHAKPGTPIVSLCNGLSPVKHLKDALPDHPIIAGMVPFNVVWRDDGALHHTSKGEIALENHFASRMIAKSASDGTCRVELHDDMRPVQYGKLLLNLVNPINALSGLSLHAMLSQLGYRRIFAAAIIEALSVYEATGTHYVKSGPFPPKLGAKMLGLPDFLFNSIVLRIQNLDAGSMTSMAIDYRGRKPTEIDSLNGEIVSLAESVGMDAPINRVLCDLVHGAAENDWPIYSSRALAQLVMQAH